MILSALFDITQDLEGHRSEQQICPHGILIIIINLQKQMLVQGGKIEISVNLEAGWARVI